jgi:hypothetical protein
MKTKNYQPLTKSAIPDGEGFIALPISFNYRHCEEGVARRSNLKYTK